MKPFTIRAQQMDALRERGKEDFIAREVRRLKPSGQIGERAPDEDWIRARVAEAADFDIVTEADLTRYHDLALASGDDFPNDTDRETLVRGDLWGWQKLDVLEADRIFNNGHPSS